MRRQLIAFVLAAALVGVTAVPAAADGATLVLGGSAFGRDAELVDVNDDWLLYLASGRYWAQPTDLAQPARRLPEYPYNSEMALAGDRVVSSGLTGHSVPPHPEPLVVVDLVTNRVTRHGRSGGAWEQARDGSIVWACDYENQTLAAPTTSRRVVFCRIGPDGEDQGRWAWPFDGPRSDGAYVSSIYDLFLTDDLVWWIADGVVRVGSMTTGEWGTAARVDGWGRDTGQGPFLVGDWRDRSLEWVIPRPNRGSQLRFTTPRFPCGDTCDFDATSEVIHTTDAGVRLWRLLDRQARRGPWTFAIGGMYDAGPWELVRVEADGAVTGVAGSHDPATEPRHRSARHRFDVVGRDWFADGATPGNDAPTPDATPPRVAAPRVVGDGDGLRITWDDRGDDVLSTLVRDGDPEVGPGEQDAGRVLVAEQTTAVRDRDVAPGRTYTYTLWQEDRRGNVSPAASTTVTLDEDGLVAPPSDPPTEEPPPTDDAPGDPTPDEPPTDEPPPGSPPRDEDPPSDRPPDDAPPGGTPPGDAPPSETPPGGTPGPPGEEPPSGTPPGEAPPGEAPPGDDQGPREPPSAPGPAGPPSDPLAPTPRNPAAAPAPAPNGSVPRRLSGGSRDATAARIARHQFPATAPVAYLARNRGVVDAVAGGVLTDGPVLLVPSCASLAPETVAALADLAPAEVVALGGPGAICDETLRAGVHAAGAQAVARRLAGADRYATSARIARHQFPGTAPRAYLARGDGDDANLVDALAGGALTDGPILLVPRCGRVPDAVAAALAALDPNEVVALGGDAAVCADVLAEAGAIARAGTSRLAGVDRFATAVRIAQHAFPGGAAAAFVARAHDVVVDAVAGGVLTQGPILLVPACGEPPTVVLDEIDRLAPSVVAALGGDAAVCEATLRVLRGERAPAAPPPDAAPPPAPPPGDDAPPAEPPPAEEPPAQRPPPREDPPPPPPREDPPPPPPREEPPPPAGDRCHPDYASPCLPIVDDLDCSDIRRVVRLSPGSGDAYRLDRDGDGLGCDSYG